jgi:Photosynthesis system II assembly factor YCF48
MKDDSARDNAIDKLLARRLGARLQDEGKDCPDAEILAGYVERTLSPVERQTCETHLVDCRLCQEQVVELVRLNESDEMEEAARPVRAKPRSVWFRWALAAPALVALVIAGLWQSGQLQQFLKQEEPATVEAPPSPVPSEGNQPRRVAGAKEPVGNELSGAAALKQETPKESETTTSAPRISVYGSPGSSVEMKPGEGVGPGYAAGVGSGVAGGVAADERQAVAQAGVPPAAPPTAPSAAPGQKAESDLALHDKDQIQRADRIETAARKAAPVQAQSEAAAQLEKGRDSGVEFHGFIRNRLGWRVGRGGIIQKAAPDGSWENRPSGVKTDLFGISFANSKVGWAVGQGGTVLRTTDGGDTWTRMPNPTSDDLVRVGAISETKVNVITRSGQTLQSADGGATWKPLG